MPALLRRVDRAVATAFGCILLLLLVGSLYSASFLSPEYLLQQLKVAAFLGVIATGMMLVILLGHIDLSVPWAVSTGAMMACAAAAQGALGAAAGHPIRHPLRGGDRGRERGRRGVPAHPVDDHYAGDQCGRTRLDGGLYRGLLAAGLGVGRDALAGDWVPGAAGAECGGDLGAGRRGDGLRADAHRLSAGRSTASATASGRRISRAFRHGGSCSSPSQWPGGRLHSAGCCWPATPRRRRSRWETLICSRR